MPAVIMNSGLGMKQTVLPAAHVVFLMMHLNNNTRSSAAASSVLNWKDLGGAAVPPHGARAQVPAFSGWSHPSRRST